MRTRASENRYIPLWTWTAVGSEASGVVDVGTAWRRSKPSTPTAGIGLRLAVPTSRLAGRRIIVSMDLRGDVGGSGYSRYIEGASVGAPYGDISKPTLNETTWNTFTYEGVINGEFTYAQALPNNGGNTFKVCVLISAATGWIELRKGGTSVRVVA